MSRPKGLTCCECGSAFTRNSNLYRHYRVQHDLEVVATTRGSAGEGAAAVACAHCPRRFSKLGNMLRHCRNVHRVECKLENQDSGDDNTTDREQDAEKAYLILTGANVRPTVDSTTAGTCPNYNRGFFSTEEAHPMSTEETNEPAELTGTVNAVLKMAEQLDESDLGLVLETATKLNETTRRLAEARTIAETALR